MKTKVYGLKGMAAGQLETTFCGVPVTLNFYNGMNAYGHSHAVLITTEPFVQDAIEADERFGASIVLEEEFDSPEAANNAYQPKSVNVEPDPVSPSVRAMREQAMREAEEQKAADQAAAEEAAKRSAAAKKGAATKKAKKVEAAKLEFDNVNDAISYFLEKGIAVTDDTLQAVLEQNNATIKSE